MEAFEPFTVISEGQSRVADQYVDINSGKGADLDVQMTAYLRKQHPELIVTAVPAANCPLLAFAASGFATAELDTETDSVFRWRGFVGPSRRGGTGFLADAVWFAKYHYKWNSEDFIMYTALIPLMGTIQYVLKEPRGSETQQSNSIITDALLSHIGAWLNEEVPAIYVYDGYWDRSTKMYEEVMKASWDAVILDPKMKKALTEVSTKFFDNKSVYDDFGVPWKRGLIFHGPAGNGKTISIKALMHTLYDRKSPVPCLYVKSAPYTWSIRAVFEMARAMSPCMLILEDIDTIVTEQTRSYFFNEVDGLENNDGILMVASTNHLDRLDPGLSKRPSRFDRKYLFPLPNKEERTMYCDYWRNKLKNKPSIEFPKKLSPAIAGITHGFSFAFLQEAFVATLLVLARDQDSDLAEFEDADSGEDDLDRYDLWKVMKEQVKILREDMEKREDGNAPIAQSLAGSLRRDHEDQRPMLDSTSLGPRVGGSKAAPHFERGYLQRLGNNHRFAHVDQSGLTGLGGDLFGMANRSAHMGKATAGWSLEMRL